MAATPWKLAGKVSDALGMAVGVVKGKDVGGVGQLSTIKSR